MTQRDPPSAWDTYVINFLAALQSQRIQLPIRSLKDSKKHVGRTKRPHSSLEEPSSVHELWAVLLYVDKEKEAFKGAIKSDLKAELDARQVAEDSFVIVILRELGEMGTEQLLASARALSVTSSKCLKLKKGVAAGQGTAVAAERAMKSAAEGLHLKRTGVRDANW